MNILNYTITIELYELTPDNLHKVNYLIILHQIIYITLFCKVKPEVSQTEILFWKLFLSLQQRCNMYKWHSTTTTNAIVRTQCRYMSHWVLALITVSLVDERNCPTATKSKSVSLYFKMYLILAAVVFVACCTCCC